MDEILASLVGFVDDVDAGRLSPETVSRVVRHTVDTVGCGAGGFDSRTAVVARKAVRGSGGPALASAYGEPEPMLVDSAAFVNATANRYLDFNDFGASGHPSDMIPALLGMAEATGRTGPELITSIYVAYEVATGLAESVPPDGGWDQGIYCSLGVAAGLSKLLGLPREQTANALALAVVPSIPLRVTRSGELSEWKAAASAHATMTATFAVRLAALGMTGPPAPFEGKYGILERVWPRQIISFGSTDDRPPAIERASLKGFPACFWAQVGIDLMMQMRTEVALDQIELIEVATCHAAWFSAGGGRGDSAEKWRPRTKETADHSMPYLLAVALVHGGINDASFTAMQLGSPVLHKIMDKTTVVGREDLTRRASRDRCPTEITLRLKDGTVVSRENDVSRGHPANPMTDEDVRVKFEGFITQVLPNNESTRLADELWDLAQLSDLRTIGQLFRRFEPQ